MSDELKSTKIDMWHESLGTSIPSFFGVLSDVAHVFILVRFLSQEQVGLFFICYAFLYLFSQIARGFGIAIRKRTSEINNGQSEYLWSGFLLIIPTLFVIFIVFWLSQPILAEFVSIIIPRSVLVAFYLATLGFSVLEFSRYYVAGCGKPALAEKLRTGIAKTSMPILTVIFLYYGTTVTNALYAVFVAYFGTAIIIFGFSNHELILPNKSTIINIITFSKWSLSTSILNDFYHRFDTILLGALVGTVAVSNYDASLRIAFLSTTFAVGISKTSNVKMSGMVELERDISKIASQTIVASSVLILPLLLISLFNAEYLLQVAFGPDYTGAKWYLILLVVVQLFQGYRLQFESIFNSYDTPSYTTRTSLYSVVVNVITAPFLVVYFGGLGVLYSTIIAEVVRVVSYESQIKSVMGDYLIPKSALLQYVLFGVLYGALELLHMGFNISDRVSLILSVFVATVIFYGLQYALLGDVRDIVAAYIEERKN